MKHAKDFDSWNEKKKVLNSRQKIITFNERDVFWCKLGINVGDEEDGKGENATRPVLIVKKYSKKLLVALPLSTQIKDKPYYHSFDFKGKQQSVILSQIRLLDSKRLYAYMGTVMPADFKIIKEKMLKLLT